MHQAITLQQVAQKVIKNTAHLFTPHTHTQSIQYDTYIQYTLQITHAAHHATQRHDDAVRVAPPNLPRAPHARHGLSSACFTATAPANSMCKFIAGRDCNQHAPVAKEPPPPHCIFYRSQRKCTGVTLPPNPTPCDPSNNLSNGATPRLVSPCSRSLQVGLQWYARMDDVHTVNHTCPTHLPPTDWVHARLASRGGRRCARPVWQPQ